MIIISHFDKLINIRFICFNPLFFYFLIADAIKRASIKAGLGHFLCS